MRRLPALTAATALALGLVACADDGAAGALVGAAEFTVTEHGTFDQGWAMSFLPGSGQLLISERGGSLQLRDPDTGEVIEVDGTPQVHDAGQAGLHDVVPGPDFEVDGTLYLSWVREHPEGAQGVLGRSHLDVDTGQLSDLDVIWEQEPAAGNGHFALRLLIRDNHLYLTSSDRQELDPAQETGNNLGAVLRLDLDGHPAPGNPWEENPELWTIGHRNPLGIAEDGEGNLWVSEMGPQGGDELNLLVAGENYGWPEVSMGVHYGGADIPDHSGDDDFRAPAEYWVPAISPGNLLIYQGDLFPDWEGSALLGGLSGQALVRVELDGSVATPVAEWDMGERIRAVEEGPDGAIWLLEDGAGGRLLELRP